jgi:hypothetical protein
MAFLVSMIVLFIIVMLCVLVGPIIISCEGAWTASVSSLSLEFFWLHPLALRGAIDIKGKKVDLRLLGRFSVSSFTGRKKKKPRSGPGAEKAAAAPAYEAHREEGHSFTEEKGPAQRESRQQATPRDARLGPLKRLRERFKNRARGRVEKMRIASQRAVFFLRQRALLGKLLRWVWRGLVSLLDLCRVGSYTVHARVGFSDPSETGKLFGYWMGVKNALSFDIGKKHQMFLEPIFNEECFEIQGVISLRTSLARFIAPALVLAITFPYFTTFKVWRAYRW